MGKFSRTAGKIVDKVVKAYNETADNRHIAKKIKNVKIGKKLDYKTKTQKTRTIGKVATRAAGTEISRKREEEKTERERIRARKENINNALQKWNGVINQSSPEAEGTSPATAGSTTGIFGWIEE